MELLTYPTPPALLAQLLDNFKPWSVLESESAQYRALKALDPAVVTYEQLDKAVGIYGPFWGHYAVLCTECDEPTRVAIEFTGTECPVFYCSTCLRKAIKLIEDYEASLSQQNLRP